MPHTPQMHVIPYLLVSDYARCQFRSMTTGMALSILCGIYLIVSFVVLLAVPVSSRDLRWYMVLLSVETERIGIRVLNLFITMCIRDDKRNISWSLSSIGCFDASLTMQRQLALERDDLFDNAA
eukprot:603872_1